jgi:hypothetical protein
MLIFGKEKRKKKQRKKEEENYPNFLHFDI